MKPQITNVSVYGEGLRTYDDNLAGITTEVGVSPDQVSYDGKGTASIFCAAIELSNGLTIMVGERDGYPPMEVWIERSSDGQHIKHSPERGLPSVLTIPDVG